MRINKQPNHFGFSKIALALAATLTAAVYAQDTSEITEEDVTDAEMEEIVVYGTGTNISGAKPVGSEVITLDREDIQIHGGTDLATITRSLPQFQRIGFESTNTSPEGAAGGNSTRGEGVNLRGLGNGATLIMVNGRRVAPGGTATNFTDAVQVPLAAVERVEVLTDGASAVYGTDALAGVVNYVTRKDYQGVEVQGRYTTNQYKDDWQASITGGTFWESVGNLGSGSIMITYEHSYADPILTHDIPYLRQDQTRFGGNDYRYSSITPTTQSTIRFDSGTPNPAIPQAGNNTYLTVPANGLPINAMPGDFILNNPAVVDRTLYSDHQPETERDMYAISLRQDITDWLEINYQGSFNQRETKTKQYISNNTGSEVAVAIDNFNFDNFSPDGIWSPFINGGGNYTILYNMAEHVPLGVDFINTNWEDTQNHTLGFNIDLTTDWKMDVDVTWGDSDNCGVCYLGNFFNNDADGALHTQIEDGIINPFSTERLTQEEWNSVRGTNIQTSQAKNLIATVKANGTVFELPAGPVKAAFGYEYFDEESQLRNLANRGPDNEIDYDDANSDTSRTNKSYFAEILIPILQGLPGVQRLDFSFAGRWDEYSDFGSAENPMIGFTWDISDEWSLLGTWGTSFKAPGLRDLDPRVFSIVFPGFFDVVNNSGQTIGGIANGGTIGNAFAGGDTYITWFGGNPTLKAEESESWSSTLVYSPEWAEGLRISTKYYEIEYSDRISGSPGAAAFLSSPEAFANYSDKVYEFNNDPLTCVNNDATTWDPLLREFIDTFLYGDDFTEQQGPCRYTIGFDTSSTNLANSFQNGIDLQMNYGFESDIGYWNVNLFLTKILNNEEQALDGEPVLERLDLITSGVPLSQRARMDVNWTYDRWNVNLAANYTGGFKNNEPNADSSVNPSVLRSEQNIPSHTLFDLNLNYRLAEFNSTVKGLTLGLNIRNLFDRDPPIVHYGQNVVDSRKHDIYGRTFQLNATMEF